MLLSSEVYPTIPFRKRTISELAESGFAQKGFKLEPDKMRAFLLEPFPAIQTDTRLYRTILVLHGVENLPNSADFSAEANTVIRISNKVSKGALIVKLVDAEDENVSTLYFNIFIKTQYCASPAESPEELERLLKRTETFATEFLCATNAYAELCVELPAGKRGSVVPVNHPDYDDAFALICPDLEIVQSALKFFPSKQALPTASELIEFFGSDMTPNNETLAPDYWDYCRATIRARPSQVARRFRSILSELIKSPSIPVKRPFCLEAKKFIYEQLAA